MGSASLPRQPQGAVPNFLWRAAVNHGKKRTVAVYILLYPHEAPGVMTITCVEEQRMRRAQPWWSGLVAAVLGGLVGVTAVAAAGAQFLPVLGAREGAVRSVYTPVTNGHIDYVTL